MAEVIDLDAARRTAQYRRIQQDVAEKLAREGDELRRAFLLEQLRRSGIMRAKDEPT